MVANVTYVLFVCRVPTSICCIGSASACDRSIAVLAAVAMSFRSVPVIPGQLELRYYLCNSRQGGFSTPTHSKKACNKDKQLTRNYRHHLLIECAGECVGDVLGEAGVDSLNCWQTLTDSDRDDIVRRAARELQQRTAVLRARLPGVRLCSKFDKEFAKSAVKAVLSHRTVASDSTAVFRGHQMLGGNSGE